jgi:hypothetical protein
VGLQKQIISHIYTIHSQITLTYFNTVNKIKSKAIPVAGCGGLQGCEMLRVTHFQDNQLTDGGAPATL